jgi:threonine dehydrogenase-like Zn-dependent dehydrogenase
MGHEFVGVIISAPPTSNLQPGQAVVVDPRIYCSNCSRCSAGNTHGCTTLGFKGLSGSGGGLSETIAVDARLCYPLPSSVDLSLAVLIEPLAVAWHAISLCDFQDWSAKSALVLGGGPIGIACMIGLRARGCKQVYVSEPTTTRAAQNKQIADKVFDPASESIEEECLKLTGGEGVDVVFDCAGVQKGMEAGMAALRHRGTYMNVAGWGTPVSTLVTFEHLLLTCCR